MGCATRLYARLACKTRYQYFLIDECISHMTLAGMSEDAELNSICCYELDNLLFCTYLIFTEFSLSLAFREQA